MSSGCGEGVLAHLVQRGEHLPGDVALQTADDLLLGLALLETPRHVVLGLLVVAQPHQHDPVQRGVGLAVTAAVAPAATSSAPALSWPTPNSATSLGAAARVSRSSSVVSVVISADRAW